MPDIPLIDERGRPFSLRAHGATTVVSFIYTQCRDARMCPLVSAKFARMQSAVRDAPIRLVLVTLDPQYDTPAVLSRYGAVYGADARVWRFATGSDDAVKSLAARFGVGLERPEPGIVVHTEAVAILDGGGRVARVIDGAAWLPDDVAAAARETASLGADPFHRMRLWLGTSASAICGGRTSGVTIGAALLLLAATASAFGAFARRAFS